MKHKPKNESKEKDCRLIMISTFLSIWALHMHGGRWTICGLLLENRMRVLLLLEPFCLKVAGNLDTCGQPLRIMKHGEKGKT